MLVFLFNSKSFSVVEADVQPIMFEPRHEIRKARLLKPEEEIKYCTHMV